MRGFLQIGEVKIDLLGAIIPVTVSLVTIAYLIFKGYLEKKPYVVGLLLAYLLTLLIWILYSGSTTRGAVEVPHNLIAIGIGFILIWTAKGIRIFHPKVGLPVGYSYAVLSAFALDLTLSSYYIGVEGTVDAIFLSGLVFLPLWTLCVILRHIVLAHLELNKSV